MDSPYSTLSSAGNEKLTLEQIKRKRALADALMSRGFHATQVGQGGSYTPFAGLADALSASLGTWRGNRDSQALDAREAELAAQQQARQDTHANLFDAQGAPSNSTLAETNQPLGRGPVPIPEPDASDTNLTTNPMHQELAGALMNAAPGLSAKTYPLSDIQSPQGEGFQGEGSQPNVQPMRAPESQPMQAPGTIPPIVQDSPPGLTQKQQDHVGDIEAASMQGDNPDYPPEIVPPGPPVELDANREGVMQPMTVTGRRPQTELLDAMKAQPAAAPQSPQSPQASPAPELVDAMMGKLGLSMPAPPQAPQAPQAIQAPQAPRQGTDDRWIRLWKSSVAVGDQNGMKFALEQMSPEQKKYVIDGALVDSTGKEVYKGQAKLDHVDLGDKIGFFDKQGNRVRTEEKGRLSSEQLATLNTVMELQGITDKKSPRYQAALNALENKLTTHPSPIVDMSTKLETKESQAKGEYNVKDYYKPVKEASVAAKKANFQLSALEGIDFKTGWGAQTKGYAASVLASFGIAPEQAKKYASDSQSFASIMQDQILQKQLAQKGPQTESDAKRMQQAGVQLTNTPQANAFIIAVAKAQNNRDIEKGNFLERYWSQNKTFEGGEDAWDTSGGAKSLFDDPAMKKFSKLGSTEGAAEGVTSKMDSITPPKELPSGTTFNGHSPNGNRLWRLPNGKIKEELQ